MKFTLNPSTITLGQVERIEAAVGKPFRDVAKELQEGTAGMATVLALLTILAGVDPVTIRELPLSDLELEVAASPFGQAVPTT